jgi:cytochrome c-type biogenesis protein CcmF
MATTEAAITNGILRDLYVVIGDPQTNGGYAMRVYIKPFANWIWGGAMLMAIGGVISLTDRRLRFAVGAKRAAQVPAE